MDKDYLIRLTLTVYQMTETFPRNNFLSFKIRNLAARILADAVLLISAKINPLSEVQDRLFEDIKALEESFQEAREQKLLKRRDFLLFKKEYGRIKSEIGKGMKKTKEIKVTKTTKTVVESVDLNERQKKILQILKEKEKIQVWELQKIFPQVSKRTLRRDLEDLLQKKSVKRIGKWNEVFYTSVGKVGQGVGQNLLG